jgi:hypothetical protein
VDILIFSQTAIFRLQQLGSQYYRLTGERFKLSTEEGIINLLQASSMAFDDKIQYCYDEFVTELNSRQIRALNERNVPLRAPIEASIPTLKQQAY